MGTINETRLATSNPVNLTRGFPFFPPNTTVDNPIGVQTIGIGGTPSISRPLVDVTIPLLAWRFRGTVSAQVVIGAFFGYNLRYTVEGLTRANGTAQLEVTNDAAQGGLGFGLGFTLTFALRIEESRITFTWASGFRTTWERVFNLSATATIDAIALVLRILRASGVNVPLEQISTVRQSVGNGAIWGLFDSVSSQFASRGGIQLRPALNVSGNLLSLIPNLAGFLKSVKKAGGKIFVGPQLNIVFPVTITIVRLTTEDGNYTAVRPTSSTLTFLGGPRISAAAPPVQNVTMVHSHTIGLEFTLEIKGSVSLWSMFSATATVPINLTAVFPFPLGARSVFGPFFTTFSARPVAAVELPEVLWG